jgi:hypothetical protein
MKKKMMKKKIMMRFNYKKKMMKPISNNSKRKWMASFKSLKRDRVKTTYLPRRPI